MRFSFKGWNWRKFLFGRKHMIITIIAGLLGYIATQNPALTAVTAAIGEAIYSILDYYTQE